MDRRQFIAGALAIPVSAAVPAAVAGTPIAATVFAVDTAAGPDVTVKWVAEFLNGAWRIIDTHEVIADDVAYSANMLAVIDAARAA